MCSRRYSNRVPPCSGGSLEAWPTAEGGSGDVIAVGGGATHATVLQLKANLLERRISTLASVEAAGLGALRLAAMAVEGLSPSAACAWFPNPTTRTWQPRPAGMTSTQRRD